jgi:hypothetical protein
MQNNMGIDSIVLKRDVNIAMRAALAFSAASTVTMPSAFF